MSVFLCKIHDTLNYILIVFFQCQQQFEAREYFTCLDVACEGSKSGQVLWWLNILFSLPTLTSTESGCCRKLSFLQEFIRKKQWALQVSLAKPFTIIGIHLPDQIDVSACRGLLFHHPYLLNARLKHVALFTPVLQHVAVAVADF